MDRRILVFDLDDTMTDWWTAIGYAAAAAAGGEAAEVFRGVVRQVAWTRRDDGAVHREHWRLRVEPLTFWHRVFPESHERASDMAERFAEELRVQLYEDVLPTLNLLSSEVELGVLSNSPFAKKELTTLGVASSFSTVVSVVDPIRKPHPEAFRQLLAAIKAEPRDVLYIGDSPISDVEPARAQGMRSVWLDRFTPGRHRLTCHDSRHSRPSPGSSTKTKRTPPSAYVPLCAC